MMKRIPLLIAVAAFAAVAVPSTASAKSIVLGLYKVEKHVDVDGDNSDPSSAAYKLSCHGNDLAMDGMWRIDNVDQDNDYDPLPPPGFLTTSSTAFDALESVLPVESDVAPLDPSTYNFRFLPLAGGDVQLKLFLTCLPYRPTGSASYEWKVGASPVTFTHSTTAAGPNAGEFDETFTDGTALNKICPTAGTIPVAPGFYFTTPTPSLGKVGNVYARWPTLTPSSLAYNAWTWGFDVDTASTPITTSYNCLALASTGSSVHHKIVVTFAPKSSSGWPQTAVKKRTQTLQVSCGEIYKGMVGAWTSRASSATRSSGSWAWTRGPRPARTRSSTRTSRLTTTPTTAWSASRDKTT